MAAQEPDNDLELCPKCFEMVSRNSPTCLEPDCPMLDRTGQSGSDAAVYPDLARANLKRMRGEYDEAVSLCLSILKRYPGNLTAHTLLGDIHAENGQLTEAAEWYEMALEIAPESPADRAKLAQVKDRLAEREMATTAKQLGLPAPTPRAKWFAWSIAGFVALVGLGGFLLGDFIRSNRSTPPVVTTPITVEGRAPQESSGARVEPESPPVNHEDAANPAGTLGAQPRQDAEAIRIVHSRCVEGARVSDVDLDLRTGAMSVTFSLGAHEAARPLAARMAASLLDCFQESPMVTLRGIQAGEIVFVADARRNDLIEARRLLPPNTPEAQADLSGILTNEWAAESQPTSPAEPGATG